MDGEFQLRGDLLGRFSGAEREVPGALLRIGDDLGQTPVHRLPARATGIGVDHRGEQRMGEANRIRGELDHLALEGGSQKTVRAVPPEGELEKLDGGMRESGNGEERSARVLGQQHDPSANEVVQVVGDRKRLSGLQCLPTPLERTDDLEGEQRVPLGGLVQTT